jgi:hypothetical protein
MNLHTLNSLENVSAGTTVYLTHIHEIVVVSEAKHAAPLGDNFIHFMKECVKTIMKVVVIAYAAILATVVLLTAHRRLLSE